MNHINLKDYDAIAFDVEGTLADTIPTHHAARQEAFKAHGFGHITLEQLALGPTYGSYPADIIGGILHAAGEIEKVEVFKDHPVVQKIMHTKGKIFEELAKDGFSEMPGAVNFVRSVAPLFVGHMALVTSSRERFITPFLERYDLVQYFSEGLIISDDTIQAEGLKGKPEPDPYQLAIRRLKATKILVFEDTVSGTMSAKEAGAAVMALGFDQHNARLLQSSELSHPPDLFVEDYDVARGSLGMS